MEVIIIKLAELAEDNFIGGRYLGEKIREAFEKAVEKNGVVIVDFEKISGITQGFADEWLGVLIRAFGRDKVKKHLQIRNLNDNIKFILNWVARYSSKDYKAKQNLRLNPRPSLQL